MKLKTSRGRQLRRCAEAYASAKVEHSWMGAKDPASWPEIELRLQKAKEALDELISELCDVDITLLAVDF